MSRKDLRNSKEIPQTPFIFRNVVSNGTSRGLNLTEFLKEWTQVRITILENTETTLSIIIEDTEILKS